MRKVLATACLVLLPCLPAEGQEPIPVSRLDAEPALFAGETVMIEGEIVGDYGIRNDVVWFQVNDDPYVAEPIAETGEPVGTNISIGVRVPRFVFDDGWGRPGDYRTRGPVVRVIGSFRYNDAETGGETFVDATGVELVEDARPLDLREADPLPAITGALLLVLGAVAFSYGRWRRIRPT